MKKLMGFEIMGVQVVPILLSAFALLTTLWMWWGSVFSESWPGLNGIVETEMDGMPLNLQLFAAFLILIQMIGFVTVMKWRGINGVMGAIQTALILGVSFMVPIPAYQFVFRPEHNLDLFLIDAAGYVVALIVGGLCYVGIAKLGKNQMAQTI